MAATKVPTANRPPPKPISAAPRRNSATEPSGAEKITAAKANTPVTAPSAASRSGLPPSSSLRAARAQAASVPPATKPVSAVVAPTLSRSTSPP